MTKLKAQRRNRDTNNCTSSNNMFYQYIYIYIHIFYSISQLMDPFQRFSKFQYRFMLSHPLQMIPRLFSQLPLAQTRMLASSIKHVITSKGPPHRSPSLDPAQTTSLDRYV